LPQSTFPRKVIQVAFPAGDGYNPSRAEIFGKQFSKSLSFKEIFVKKNIFGSGFMKKKPPPAHSSSDTIPLSPHQVDETLVTIPHIHPDQLIYGCGQSVGKQREHNEDCIFALSNAIGGETGSDPLGLFIVADGMGGHQYGEVASSIAVRTLAGCILKRFQVSLVDPSTRMDASIQDLIRAAIGEAQNAVKQAAPGSGTTLTVALVLGRQVTIGHVGDSRAYTIHPNGAGEALTRDHSLVKRMQELGQISSEEAAIHPQRNVLYRALGQGELLEPDIITAPFPQSDYLLLCSDGLWSVLSDGEIFNRVTTAKDLQGACQDLVAAANQAGGPDNISVIVVKHTA
jgi:serine/threonine protein phosphatase PrpC